MNEKCECVVCGGSDDVFLDTHPICIKCAYSVNESIGIYPAELKRMANEVVVMVEYDPNFDENLHTDYSWHGLSDEQLRPQIGRKEVSDVKGMA